MMGGQVEWLLLAYRLPRQPSTPRIALWRRLRLLGALNVVDGRAVLPADAWAKEQFDWLADEVAEAGGEALVWTAKTASPGFDRVLAFRMASAAAQEYTALADAARAAGIDSEAERRRTLVRLRRELRRVRGRDHFSPPERQSAEAALRSLAKVVVHER
jgi:hypothetical protein